MNESFDPKSRGCMDVGMGMGMGMGMECGNAWTERPASRAQHVGHGPSAI
jgi:hypothetical protein